MAVMVVVFAWHLMSGVQVMAQAVPAGELPPGEANPTDQLLPGQTLGSNLTLNQGVNAINAENQSFQRFGLGLSASGGEVTNFLGTQTNQVSAGYGQFTADAAVLLHNERTRYFLLYQPQYNLYPKFSQVNNFSQMAFQSLTHAMSDRSGLEWDATAARYLSLNQFLPESLGIGGIGVVVPTLGVQLLQDSFEVTNAATTLTFKYLINSRMTFTGSATGSFFMIIPSLVTTTSTATTPPPQNLFERFITSGGVARLTYQLTSRDAVGAAITPVYIYGLNGAGGAAAETLQATYARELTPTFTATVGAGPLFIQSSSFQIGNVKVGSYQTTSYAVNASLSRQMKQSQFAVNYSRAILVNLLEPAIVANIVSSNAYLGFGSKWIFTGAGSYTHDGGNGALYGPGQFYGGSAQIAYQAANSVQLFARYSLLSESFSLGTNQPSFGFTRNQFGGGIQFNLGNPIARSNNSNLGGSQ
jgi:hypothetical protein